jgi:hypothetical protein
LTYHADVWFTRKMNLQNPTNLRALTDKILLDNLRSLVQKEREVTLQVLHHLREVERRSLYAKLAYPSLFEYVVKELKYSEGAAQRRISSMRLLREVPSIEAKVGAGTLSLSALAKAQSFFRQESKNINTPAKKIEILSKLENKSLVEVEKELVRRSSNPLALVPEKIRPVTSTHSELKILVEDVLLKEIEELRGLLAHAKPHASIKDLIAYAVNRTVKELRPKAPIQAIKAKSSSKPDEKANEISRRYIPAEVKRRVWKRDCGECSFIDPGSNRKCCSKHGLEYDHIVSFGVGGNATESNLRLRCRAHNQLAAVVAYGVQKMARHVPRMN